MIAQELLELLLAYKNEGVDLNQVKIKVEYTAYDHEGIRFCDTAYPLFAHVDKNNDLILAE
jgi:hypothetical protein